MTAVLLILSSVAVGEEAQPLPTFVPVELSKNVEPLCEGRVYEPVEAGLAEADAYSDETINVRVHRFRAYDTPIFAAFVQIADASQLRTKQAKAYPSSDTVWATMISEQANAVLAVNADWFTYHNAGIIYRNGELLRDKPNADYDGLAIDDEGDFHLIVPLTREGFDAIGKPVINSFCFGPALVRDGEVCDITQKETQRQRTAIGQIDKLSYVLVVTDGPEEKDSVGLTVADMAQLMKDLGAVTAYNLDGGVSSIMLLNSKKVNGQKEEKQRRIGDIVYFSTALSQ